MSENSLDTFLKACGGDDVLRLVVNDGTSIDTIELRQPFALVGRDPRADVRLIDDHLGMRHALFQLIDGRLLFVEFQGQSPSESRRAGWLDPGQSLPFGRMTIQMAPDAKPAKWAATGASMPSTAAPVATLELRTGRTRNVWQMKKHLVLMGSSSKCKIRLLDSEVSRFHCALVGTPDGIWAFDLMGRGGIAINGVKVRAGRIDDDDRLQIGRFTVSRCNTPTDGIEPAVGRSISFGSVAKPMLPLASANSMAQALPDSWPAPPRSPNAAETALVAQFTQLQHQMYASLQQQMAEQFQQIMQMFVEGCWTMQQEQSRAVRRELKRMRLLTDKLAAIQAKPDKYLAASQSTTGSGKETGSASEALPCESTEVGAEAQTPNKKLTTIEQAPVEVHAWLNQRVAEIQSERQNTWQRIVSLIQGRPASKAATAPVQQLNQ